MSFNVKNPAEFSGVQNLVVDGHSQLVDVSCTTLDVGGNATISGTLDVGGITTIDEDGLRVNSLDNEGTFINGNTILARLNNSFYIHARANGSGEGLFLRNTENANTFDWFKCYYNGNITSVSTIGSHSDDRIKKNEKYIHNAISTINKLTPQIYEKYLDFDCSGNFILESGLIVQEVYYSAPELRHLIQPIYDLSKNVIVPIDISLNEGYSITDDICYNDLNWGTQPASLRYTELIPYLIKAIQEQQEIINEEKEKNQTQYNNLLTRIQALESSS